MRVEGCCCVGRRVKSVGVVFSPSQASQLVGREGSETVAIETKRSRDTLRRCNPSWQAASNKQQATSSKQHTKVLVIALPIPVPDYHAPWCSRPPSFRRRPCPVLVLVLVCVLSCLFCLNVPLALRTPILARSLAPIARCALSPELLPGSSQALPFFLASHGCLRRPRSGWAVKH